MKILFFGLGSIGKKHARLLKENFDHDLYAYRLKSKNNDLGIKEIYDLNEIDRIKPDVAFITNPTSEHVKFALVCAEKGIDLFIEKPLSHNRESLDLLDEIIKKNNIKVYVAYCLRFHPVIKKLKTLEKPQKVSITCSSYLPDWNSNDHLKSYSAQKSLGGGVILDLSHEIDYAHYLFGKSDIVKAAASKLSNVTIDAEDNAYIILDFSGTKCEMHLDFMSKTNKRKIILEYEDKTIVADLLENSITIVKDKNYETEYFKHETDDMYLEQLKHFFNKASDSQDWEEAKKIFEIIMKIKEVAI